MVTPQTLRMKSICILINIEFSILPSFFGNEKWGRGREEGVVGERRMELTLLRITFLGAFEKKFSRLFTNSFIFFFFPELISYLKKTLFI